MDPPTALDKNLSSTTSTSTSRLWRSSKNAPVTGTVKGERQRLNFHCSQNGQNKKFLRRLCVILSALAPFVCFQFYFLYKLTNGKDATEQIAYQLGSSSGYEIVTTNYGWTTTASKNFTRRIVSGEFFRAVLSHPNYNKSAWQDLEEHPDQTRKLAVFLDVDTCLENNYPTYVSRKWWLNVEKDHPARGDFKSHILESCQYIKRAAQSPALLANPDSKLVLIDCSGSRRFNLVRICKKEFEEINSHQHQVVVAYMSIARKEALEVDIGLPPPAIKPINLTSEEVISVNECRERKYVFSFQGNPGHGRDQLVGLKGEDDVYINVVSRKKYMGDITVGGNDTMNYADILKQSYFSASPRGDNLFSYRFAEILSAGAVPVVYADDWLPPFNTPNVSKKQAFDWSNCAVFIPESKYNKTLDIIRAIPITKRCKMQQCAVKAWERYASSRAGWLRGILASLPHTNHLDV
eukprot:scaffold1199_cov150-Skeletonema_dohrnii-CCMP3373.AAC.7